MSKEIIVVKKSNSISVYKTPSNWILKIGNETYQYTEMINGETEQAVTNENKHNNPQEKSTKSI